MTLPACSSDDGDAGAASEKGTAPLTTASVTTGDGCGDADASAGTVTLWHSLSGSITLDALDELSARMTSDIGVTLEFRRFESDTDLMTNLANSAEGDQPDMVLVTEQATRALLDSERFLYPDVCDAGIAADLLPQVAATYSFQDRLVALPFGVSTQVLIFDAARLRAAGLDPNSPPTTLSDLLTASEQVVASGASDFGLVATDSCAAILVPNYSAKRGVVLGSDGNGHAGRMQSVDLAKPEIVEDLTALRDAAWEEHVRYIGANPSGFDDLVNLTMPSGGGMMAMHTSAALGEIIALLDNGNFDDLELGVAPLPGPGVGALVGGNALWLRSNSDEAQLGRAWRALEWLYDPAQLASFDAATGYSPPTASAAKETVLLEAWDANPVLRVAYDQIVSTPTTTASTAWMLGPSGEVASQMYRLCDRIIENGADVERALRDATDAINNLIALYEAQFTGAPLPTTTTVADRGTQTVTGRVRCESGAPVVGMWIDSSGSNSGWADLTPDADNFTAFSREVGADADYQLHVGCGGTSETWGAAYFSEFVMESGLSFVCADGQGRYHGRCEVVSD